MSTALVHLLSIYPVEPAPASLCAAASDRGAAFLAVFLAAKTFINLFSKQQQLTANLTVLELSLRAFHATFTLLPCTFYCKKKGEKIQPNIFLVF